MSDTEKITEIMQKAFSEFCNNYSPVTDNQENEAELKTTPDLQIMFSEFTGLEVSRFEMADMMQQAKFTFKLIDNEFYWFLKKV